MNFDQANLRHSYARQGAVCYAICTLKGAEILQTGRFKAETYISFQWKSVDNL
jgi:hypothetical protein